jgi:hypothetical protein
LSQHNIASPLKKKVYIHSAQETPVKWAQASPKMVFFSFFFLFYFAEVPSINLALYAANPY